MIAPICTDRARQLTAGRGVSEPWRTVVFLPPDLPEPPDDDQEDDEP